MPSKTVAKAAPGGYTCHLCAIEMPGCDLPKMNLAMLLAHGQRCHRLQRHEINEYFISAVQAILQVHYRGVNRQVLASKLLNYAAMGTFPSLQKFFSATPGMPIGGVKGATFENQFASNQQPLSNQRLSQPVFDNNLIDPALCQVSQAVQDTSTTLNKPAFSHTSPLTRAAPVSQENRIIFKKQKQKPGITVPRGATLVPQSSMTVASQPKTGLTLSQTPINYSSQPQSGLTLPTPKDSPPQTPKSNCDNMAKQDLKSYLKDLKRTVAEHGPASNIMAILKRMRTINISDKLLRETKAMMTVAAQKNHEDRDVAILALDIEREWKKKVNLEKQKAAPKASPVTKIAQMADVDHTVDQNVIDPALLQGAPVMPIAHLEQPDNAINPTPTQALAVMQDTQMANLEQFTADQVSGATEFPDVMQDIQMINLSQARLDHDEVAVQVCTPVSPSSKETRVTKSGKGTAAKKRRGGKNQRASKEKNQVGDVDSMISKQVASSSGMNGANYSEFSFLGTGIPTTSYAASGNYLAGPLSEPVITEEFNEIARIHPKVLQKQQSSTSSEESFMDLAGNSEQVATEHEDFRYWSPLPPDVNEVEAITAFSEMVSQNIPPGMSPAEFADYFFNAPDDADFVSIFQQYVDDPATDSERFVPIRTGNLVDWSAESSSPTLNESQAAPDVNDIVDPDFFVGFNQGFRSLSNKSDEEFLANMFTV